MNFVKEYEKSESELNESSGLKFPKFNNGFDTKSQSDKESTFSVKENVDDLTKEYDANESSDVNSPTKDERSDADYLRNKKVGVNGSSELKRFETDLNH